MTEKTMFKARLIAHPEAEVTDAKTKKVTKKKNGIFTVGKSYRVFGIFDNGKGFTDFLVVDDEGIFRWVRMDIFRSRG